MTKPVDEKPESVPVPPLVPGHAEVSHRFTVWPVSVWFVQTTVVPSATVHVRGRVAEGLAVAAALRDRDRDRDRRGADVGRGLDPAGATAISPSRNTAAPSAAEAMHLQTYAARVPAELDPRGEPVGRPVLTTGDSVKRRRSPPREAGDICDVWAGDSGSLVVAVGARRDGRGPCRREPASVPSAPAKPTVTPANVAACVNWVAPASNGSAINAYFVTPLIGTVSCSPPTCSRRWRGTGLVTGLKNGTTYTFKVKAA